MNPNYANPLTVQSGGGGLWDSCWVRITDARTEMHQFKKPCPVMAYKCIEQESGEEHEELPIIGSADQWDVDGNWMISKNGKALHDFNSGARLIKSISETGFPWDLNNLSVKQLVGHWFFVNRYEVLDNKGNPIPKVDKSGQTTQYNMTAIEFTKWGGNGQTPNENAGGATTAPAAQAAAQPTDFPSAAVEAAVVAALTTAGGTMPVANVPTVVATTPPAGFDVAQHMPYVAPGSAWLTDAARPWTVVNGNLTKK